MTGRDELDKKIKLKIETKLAKEDTPEIISRYYYWMPSSMTMATKRNYIDSVIRYANYLKENGNSIEDMEFLKNQKRTDFNMYENYITYKKNGEKASVSNITLNMYALKSFYEFLVSEEILEVSPFYKYKIKIKQERDKEDEAIVALTKAEIKKIKLSIIDNSVNYERDYAIFVLGIRTGLRVRSIIEINMEDINWEERYIKVVTKGDKTRRVFFGEDTEEALKTYLIARPECENNALFLERNNKRISYDAVYKMIRRHSEMVNKNVTPHKMRSTCGTNIYQKSGDIYLTAEVLGHKNIKNTKRYTKIGEEKKRKAADILDKL